MAVSDSYREYALDQLGRVIPVTARAMFGGVGIYGDAVFFALIADDRLYFKVDDTNRPDFERHGMGPFRPFDGEGAMRYYEVPGEVLDDVDALRPWVDGALAVARASRTRRKHRQGPPQPR